MDAEKVEMVTEWMNNYSQKRKLKKLRQQDRQMAAQNARRMQQSVHEFYMGVVVLCVLTVRYISSQYCLFSISLPNAKS